MQKLLRGHSEAAAIREVIIKGRYQNISRRVPFFKLPLPPHVYLHSPPPSQKNKKNKKTSKILYFTVLCAVNLHPLHFYPKWTVPINILDTLNLWMLILVRLLVLKVDFRYIHIHTLQVPASTIKYLSKNCTSLLSTEKIKTGIITRH